MIKNDLIRVNILFLSLSLILSIYLLGFRYFDPTNTSWLFWGDLPTTFWTLDYITFFIYRTIR